MSPPPASSGSRPAWRSRSNADLRRSAGRVTFFFFAPKGNRIPLQGTAAVWVLHRHAIYRLADCLDIGCPSSLDYMLVSDSDVRPLGEWNRLIDSLGRKAS